MRLALGLTQEQFGKEIGHAQSKISKAERGTTPGADLLEAICIRYSNLNARWLLTGQGDMWAEPNSSDPGGDLPIDEMEELGSRGSLGSAWAAVGALTAAYPDFATISDLAEIGGVDENAIRQGLQTLQRRQLLDEGKSEGAAAWRLSNGSALIRSADPANINQHGLEALRVLTQEIVPATEQGRGLLYGAILHLPGGGRQLGRAMLEALRAQLSEHKGEAGPEALSVLFGVAVKEDQR